MSSKNIDILNLLLHLPEILLVSNKAKTPTTHKKVSSDNRKISVILCLK
jgi:hypothetical protein